MERGRTVDVYTTVSSLFEYSSSQRIVLALHKKGKENTGLNLF